MTNIEILAWITTYIILFSMLIFSELQRSESNKQREKILQEITKDLTNKN